jgi:hypothetical protein
MAGTDGFAFEYRDKRYKVDDPKFGFGEVNDRVVLLVKT